MGRASLLTLVLALAACATLGSEGAGDRDLPSAGAGPFRPLTGDEVPGIAPFVLDDRAARYREPAVLPLDPGDVSSRRVALYAVAAERTAGGTRDVIVRTRADDGRAFGANPVRVLAADAAWEGGADGPGLSGPSALWVGGRVYLYYAAAGGIGLARSDDGILFAKESAPVLGRAGAPVWEATAPRAPSVALDPAGRWHLLYVSGAYLGEAESDDGITWRRAGDGPVFGPSPPVDPATLAPGEKPPFDGARVDDPCLAPRLTPAGRLHMRVLYTGYDATGASTIGFAARYGERGPLVRQPAPVYAVGHGERAPALLEGEGGGLLYVGQDRQVDPTTAYAAIAAGVAPLGALLPAPADRPRDP